MRRRGTSPCARQHPDAVGGRTCAAGRRCQTAGSWPHLKIPPSEGGGYLPPRVVSLFCSRLFAFSAIPLLSVLAELALGFNAILPARVVGLHFRTLCVGRIGSWPPPLCPRRVRDSHGPREEVVRLARSAPSPPSSISPPPHSTARAPYQPFGYQCAGVAQTDDPQGPADAS